MADDLGPCPRCGHGLYRTPPEWPGNPVACTNLHCPNPNPPPEPAWSELAFACPHCGHHTLYRPEDYIEGGPVVCANPWCDSNHPPEPALSGRP